MNRQERPPFVTQGKDFKYVCFKGRVCNIWRFSQETERSSGYILDFRALSLILPLPSLPVNYSAHNSGYLIHLPLHLFI